MNTYKIKYLLFSLLAGIAISCEKIEIPKEDTTGSYNQVYLSAASRNPNTVVLKMADSVYHITYGASFGGYDMAPDDILVSFETDAAKAQAYNELNGTQYELLPASSYELSQMSATIPKGTVSTIPLAININPSRGLDLFKEYLLPLSIAEVSGDNKINETLGTAYYIIEASLDAADFPAFDRSGWSIAGVSSEEPAEGSNGGLGTSAIDNNTETYWHSKWDGGYAPSPHWLAIDMGETHEIHGLAFTGRQSSNTGKPHTVQVDVSANGIDWTDAGLLTLQNTNSQQNVFLPAFAEGRYIRITMVSNYGNEPFTHLAELGAF